MIKKKPGQYEFRCKSGHLLIVAAGVTDGTVWCKKCKEEIEINFVPGNTFVDRIVKK